MSGKARPSLCKSIIERLPFYKLSETEKKCIKICIEKQMPKKPFKRKEEMNCYCANCKNYVGFIHELSSHTAIKYCYKCGQALDWSDYK